MPSYFFLPFRYLFFAVKPPPYQLLIGWFLFSFHSSLSFSRLLCPRPTNISRLSVQEKEYPFPGDFILLCSVFAHSLSRLVESHAHEIGNISLLHRKQEVLRYCQVFSLGSSLHRNHWSLKKIRLTYCLQIRYVRRLRD